MFDEKDLAEITDEENFPGKRLIVCRNPLLADDADIAGAQVSRKSVVAKAKRSSSAKQKDATRPTPEGLPVQSFQDLLKDMATLCRNRFESSENVFHQLTQSTALQRRVLELLATNA